MATFLYNRSGKAIGFRRTPDDKFLWDTHGHWIGWFPWGDDDAVDKSGKYLGTVVQNRLLRRNSPRYRGYPGYPGYPGYAGYPGYGGYAGYFGHVSGFSDVPEELIKR